MRKLLSSALLVFSTTLLVAEDKPETLNMALKLSTLGFGVDVSTPISNNLSARFNLNGASYSDTDTQDGNDYEGTLDLLTAGLLLDYYPLKNNFRVSGGVYYNGNEFKGTQTPSSEQTIEINGIKYSTDQVTAVNSHVTFNQFSPYAGLGWGNDAHDKGWGFTFDLGVMYHGSADVTLTPEVKNALLAPIVNVAVKEEEKDVEDDLANYKIYPVVSVGVNYSF